MRSPPRLRRRKGGFSALYGALGVVLVSTAVIGGVLATATPAQRPPVGHGALAPHFLHALLQSDAANATTLAEALADSCFTSGCDGWRWNASELRSAISTLGGPLARAMGYDFVVVVAVGHASHVRVGNAPADAAVATAFAEVFRPAEGDFVGVSLLLAPRL